MANTKKLFSIFFISYFYRFILGDSCQLETTRELGVCKLIQDCKEAIVDLKNGIRPQHCGFLGKSPVVCCVSRNSNEAIIDLSTHQRSKSEEKCEEYSKRKLIFVKKPFHIAVVGGTKTDQKEYPHMAALGFGDESKPKWLCGGALITDQHVLTAAHCTFSREDGKVRKVLLGAAYLSITVFDSPQTFTVSDVIRHPEYRPPSKYNDIAILKLDQKANFTDWVKPACLHSDDQIGDVNLTATGWGSDQYNGNISDSLMKVDLTLFSDNECTEQFPPNRNIKAGIDFRSMLCAGGRDVQKDTCQGDSGGPLQYKRSTPKGFYNVVGITSFGKGCGYVNTPGVYTRVSSFVPWIESVVWS